MTSLTFSEFEGNFAIMFDSYAYQFKIQLTFEITYTERWIGQLLPKGIEF